MHRIFLLSPANVSGVRGRIIMNEEAEFELAVRLRSTGAPLAEVFAFISGLYFRGKSAYATAFATPPSGVSGATVITAGRGLISADTVITLEDLRSLTGAGIDAANLAYREPLERDALNLRDAIPHDCEVVLLGSIATSKYLEPLAEIFGMRLLVPSRFVGLGDMSRGGLMLQCVRERTELDYIPAQTAPQRKPRRQK